MLVERELLQVADARREHLEVGAVRIGAHHRALVRIRPDLAVAVGDVEADVADLPVEAPVRAHQHAGDAVPAEGRVDVHALGDGVALVEAAVALGVAQAVDARRHDHDQILAVGQDAADGVPRRVVVEALVDDLRLVGDAVAVGVR